jgi:hypothetical protein
MTSKQKAWLDAHPNYTFLGVPGGMVVYKKRGLLLPNGKFEEGATEPKPHHPEGTFAVGIREVREPGTLADPRVSEATRKI